MNPSSGQPCHTHVGRSRTISLPVHSTQLFLDRATFSKTTLYTDNHFRKNLLSLFQNNFFNSFYQQAQSGRKTTLKNPEYESAGNLRLNTPTGYEPKEFTTEEIATIPMTYMSPEEDIYQFFDVQRKFGEQDQQAPAMEETRGFGQIQVQSLLDQEMAKMSPIEKMSYLQSRMHFDESMESNADSDLEAGEIRKLLTSQPYTGCNGQSGKRGQCTNVSFIRRSGSYRETSCIVFTKT